MPGRPARFRRIRRECAGSTACAYTIVLLLGMMIVVANLRLSGFFRVITHWIAAYVRRPIHVAWNGNFFLRASVSVPGQRRASDDGASPNDGGASPSDGGASSGGASGVAIPNDGASAPLRASDVPPRRRW
jgi:hypothetical protein